MFAASIGEKNPIIDTMGIPKTEKESNDADIDVEFGWLIDLVETNIDETTTASVSSLTSTSSDSFRSCDKAPSEKAANETPADTIPETFPSMLVGFEERPTNTEAWKRSEKEKSPQVDESTAKDQEEVSNKSPSQNRIHQIVQRAKARRTKLEQVEDGSSSSPSSRKTMLLDHILVKLPESTKDPTPETSDRQCTEFHPSHWDHHVAPPFYGIQYLPGNIYHPSVSEYYCAPQVYYPYHTVYACHHVHYIPGDYSCASMSFPSRKYHPSTGIPLSKRYTMAKTSTKTRKLFPSRIHESRPRHKGKKEDALSTSLLKAMSPQTQHEQIGDRLYHTVAKSHPELAARITGILLESEVNGNELLNLLENPNAVRHKILEVLCLLESHR